MVPDRPKGKKERGKRPCGVTAERVNHSKGKAIDKFIANLEETFGSKFSDYQIQCFADSTKHGGLELLAKFRQSKVEGWKRVGSWKIFLGSYTDYETGEEFDHKGRYIYKLIDGEMRTVQWEMELTEKERLLYLPKNHPLYPGKKEAKKRLKGDNIAPAARVADPSAALAMFSKALETSRR
jgi:hypothetical protein